MGAFGALRTTSILTNKKQDIQLLLNLTSAKPDGLMWEPTQIRSDSYLVMSNDRRSVWLVDRYQEDGSLEIDNGRGRTKQIKGKYWRICRPVDDRKLITQRDAARRVLVLGVFPDQMYDESLVQWEAVRDMISTKKEAFAVMARVFDKKRRLVA